MEPNALDEFARDVYADLRTEHPRAIEANSTLIFGAIDPATIITIITAIVNAIRACRAPAPAPVATAADAGEELLDAANTAWDARRGEYRGFYYRRAIDQTVDSVEGFRRKQRRIEAAKVVVAIFDRARDSTPDRLAAVAAEI